MEDSIVLMSSLVKIKVIIIFIIFTISISIITMQCHNGRPRQ